MFYDLASMDFLWLMIFLDGCRHRPQMGVVYHWLAKKMYIVFCEENIYFVYHTPQKVYGLKFLTEAHFLTQPRSYPVNLFFT